MTLLRALPRPSTSPHDAAPPPGGARCRLSPVRRWPLIVSVAFALTSVGLLANPAHVFAWDANSFSPADEQELITLTNQARANAGL